MCAYGGFDEDNCRWTGSTGDDMYVRRWYPSNEIPILPDSLNIESPGAFGGPHASQCQFVLCDGSVKGVAYRVDIAIHQGFGSRNDRKNKVPN